MSRRNVGKLSCGVHTCSLGIHETHLPRFCQLSSTEPLIELIANNFAWQHHCSKMELHLKIIQNSFQAPILSS